MFEDRRGLAGQARQARPYPWRFATEPELVLDEADWVDAEPLKAELEHVRKWPAEHWKLAFQGQLRTAPERDADDARRSAARGAPRVAA